MRGSWCVRVCVWLSMLGVYVGLIVWAKAQLIEENDFFEGLKRIPVDLDIPIPEDRQKAIDQALEIFSIRVNPQTTVYPTYDPQLLDRGLTSQHGYLQRKRVTVGPAAYESWAVLASTLAHEIEVHCEQDFLSIRLLDMVGLNGTERAERFAYEHELAARERFGLVEGEVAMIHQIMEQVYPKASFLHSNRPHLSFRQRLVSWLHGWQGSSE